MAKSATEGTKWQTKTKSSSDRLQYLYKSGEYCDLDIVFPKDEVTFKAHRLILSMSSPVFGAMLMGPLSASKELALPEDSPEAFKKLLDYMYLDRMDLRGVKEALQVYALAHKYEIESAKEVCVKEFNRYPYDVMPAKDVSCLSKETMLGLLKDDNMKFSSEVVPFKGVIAWGEAQLDDQEKPSGFALREKIEDLLKEIRFLTMSCTEFVDNVVNTNVLSHTECIHIQMAIQGANPSVIPESTPLNPTRTKRRASSSRALDACGCFSFLGPWGHDGSVTENYFPHEKMHLISRLWCSENINIHYLCAPTSGIIWIEDKEGNVIGSAASKEKLFTFTTPIALEDDKEYRIAFSPKILFEPYGFKVPAVETITECGVTLSCEKAYWCRLYFSKVALDSDQRN